MGLQEPRPEEGQAGETEVAQGNRISEVKCGETKRRVAEFNVFRRLGRDSSTSPCVIENGSWRIIASLPVAADSC